MYTNFKNLQESTNKLKTADVLIKKFAKKDSFLKVEPIYKTQPKKKLVAFGINLYSPNEFIGTVCTFAGSAEGNERAAIKYAKELTEQFNLN